jgi:hypothetical protein
VGISLSACLAGTPAAVKSPTTAPLPALVKLADAQPLGDMEDDNMQVTMTDKLSSPQTNDTIYFGEIDEFASDDDQTPIAAVPVIAVHPDAGWKAVSLTGRGIENAGWKYVGAGPGKKEIWGVLDTSAGETRSRFVVAHSTDGGDTFTLRVFLKPCRLAVVSDFAMTRGGHGRVTLSLDTESGKSKPGLYNYDTADDGATWSDVPRFEPDSMIRADEVPDDEQPEPKQVTPKTAFHATKAPDVHPGLRNVVPLRGHR